MERPTLEELTPEMVGDFIRSDSRNRQTELRQSILEASATNPDSFAEATKLGRDAQVPAQLVESDIDVYRNDKKLPEDLGNRIVTDFPQYAAWLMDSDNARLTHDDVPLLTQTMDAMRSFPGTGLQSLGMSIQGVGNTFESAAATIDAGYGNSTSLARYLEYRPTDAWQRVMYGTLAAVAEPTGSFIRDVGTSINPPEERQNTVTNITGGVGQVAGQILTHVASRGAATLPMLFGQGAQQQTDRLDAAGVSDPETRLEAQALGGAVTAATERVELGFIMKGVPGLNRMMGALPKQLQNKWAKRTLDVGAAGFAEGAQETVENFLQDVVEYTQYNPDVEFFQDWKKTAAEAGAVGAISRALILGVTARRSGTRAMEEDVARSEVKAAADATKEMIRETKLQDRDQQKMAEALKAGNPEGKTVTLDGTVVQQFFQSGIDPEALFALAPEARQQFQQSAEAGTDITIPLDEFLHAVASAPDGSYDFMTDFLKVDASVDPSLQGWDLQNPDELNAFVQQSIRQAQEEWGGRFEQVQEAAMDERIERQIRDNLMNPVLMGEKVRAPEAAATEAATIASYFRTRIARGGVAAERVFMNRVLEGGLMIEGFTPPVRRIGTGSAYYDRLRRKVKERAAAGTRRSAKQTQGLFGSMSRTRGRASPTPLINYLISKGGIERGSPIATELEVVGITPKTHSRLFTRGSLRDIDNLPVEELETAIGATGVFSRDADLNNYVSRDELIDRLGDEARGDYIRTNEQMEQELLDEQEQQILDALVNEGVDIRTANAQEIDAALDAAVNRAQLEYEAAQPGSFYQLERGVTQFTDRGRTIIKLFEGADQSTLMHEAGHLFLDLDAEIARQPDAPEAFKEQFQDTLQWLGVNDYADVGTIQHEQFARGFEAYLYSGEAPSSALKQVFQRMKVWFTRLYRSVKQLNVPIDDNMRRVYDRLLATDQEIEAIRSNPVVGIDAQTMQMLTQEQGDRYLRAKNAAISEAKDKLFRKAYRQAMRQNTEFWRNESARMQREVEGELQQQPVYRATQFAQTGMNFQGESMLVNDDGQPVDPQNSLHKMNEALVIQAFDATNPAMKLGREEVKYLPRGVRTSDGGIDPAIVADMFGFTSSIDMLQAMQKVEPYNQAVQRQTEARMIAQYGDMLNDGTIEQEALAMVMAEDTKAAQIELKALSEKTGALYPSDGDFARAAEIAIGTLTVDQATRPDKYYRAALKASREYGQAVGAGDWVAAADAKRREVLNKHLHKLSKKARDETNAALAKFKKLEKMPPRGDAKKVKIDPEYHQKIWDILDKYNLAPRLSDARRLKIELKAINDWIVTKEVDEDAQLMMPPELMAADEKTHYRDMTMDEFRGMRDLITNLETQGRNKRKFITQGQQRALDDLASELIATAEQFNSPEVVPLLARRENASLGKQFGNIVNGIDAVNTKTSQVLVRLDGGENFGLWTQTVYEPIQRAEIASNVRKREEYKRYRDIMARHFSDESSGFMDRVIMNDPTGQPLKYEAMLSIAMHQGTNDNRQKMLDGYAKTRGWNQQFIDNALANMTARDWDFVQDVWRYMDSFWPETSAVEKRRYGYAPKKIEGRKFTVTTADGVTKDIEGGYMRIMYDATQDPSTASDQLNQTFKEMQIGKNSRAQTRRGAMIERVSGVRRPIRLDIDVIAEHVSEQVGVITMAEPVENVSKVLRRADVQETLQSLIGRNGKEMLDLWLQDVAVGGALAGGTINGALRMLRSNYTVGRLGLRPLTAMLQFSGLSHTVADYGPKATARGVAKVFSRGNPYTVAREVAEKSIFMQERRFTLNRDMKDALAEYTAKAGNVRQKVAAMMMYPMQKMQEIVDTATWITAYDASIASGQVDVDAVREADLAVARLQASGLVSDLAAIERGTLSTGTQRQELVKAATMFFSYFNAKYNLLKNKNIQFKNKQIGGVDLAMSYLMALMVEGCISAFLMGQINFDDDDDGEITAGEIATGLITTTLSTAAATVPFLRDAWGAMDGFTKQSASEKQIDGLGKFIASSANLIYGAGEMLITGQSDIIDDTNPYQFVRQGVDALSTFTPLPASTINQFVRGMELQDRTGDAEALDYLVYRENRF